MAARVVARARLAFNWEVTEYDRPSYGHYIWYSNITNNSVQAYFPCAEIEAQLQQFDASIQLTPDSLRVWRFVLNYAYGLPIVEIRQVGRL